MSEPDDRNPAGMPAGARAPGSEGGGQVDAGGKRERMAETVRLVVTRRERAARSPAMERALKRLVWRYSHALQDAAHLGPAAETSDRSEECSPDCGQEDEGPGPNHDPEGFEQKRKCGRIENQGV